jgi:hypothetical protein
MGLRTPALAAALLLLLPAVACCDTGYGSLYPPALDLGDAAGPPVAPWDPQPGDVVLSNSTRPGAALMYVFALTGPPAHAGVVVRLPDGRPAVAEAGGEGVFTTRVTPLDQRVGQYGCSVWVRRRCVPLTAEQSCRLTEFALAADGGGYAWGRGIGMGARLGARGPLRTYHLGRPRGCGKRYFCGEFVVEALAYAGAVDPATARPGAVLPRDLFFDSSANPYFDRFPPLGCGWEAPSKWDCCRAGGRCCDTPAGHVVGSSPVGGRAVAGYAWPGDYHDPRYPDPIPLKQVKGELPRKEKPAVPSELLPRPRPVGGDALSAWLQRRD